LIVDDDTEDDNSNNNNETTTTTTSATISNINTSLEQVLCEMEGPTGTPYEGRFFVLKLTFTSDFPAAPPRGFFLTKIYHPNVDMTTGAICVNTLKKDWTSTTTLSHVLAVIRCLLIVPFPESSLNDEAGKLFMESYGDYAKRAKIMACVHGRTYDNVENKNNNGNADNNGNDKLQQPEEADPSTKAAVPPKTLLKPGNTLLRSNSNNSNKKLVKKSSTLSAASNAKLARKKSLKRL